MKRIIIAILASLLLSLEISSPVFAQDWLDGWSNRREITLTSTGTAHTDYQVRIDFTSSHSSVFSTAQADGADLRCTSDDGTTLIDMWIEEWDNVGEVGELWCEVPSIASGVDTTIYVYYGNAGASSVSNIDDTFLWGEDFASVAQGVDDPHSDDITVGNEANYANNAMIIENTSTWNATQIREMSNVVKDGSTWNMYVSGVDASNNVDSGLYTTTDLTVVPSEDAGNPIMTGAEDCYITLEWETPGAIWTDASGDMFVVCERYTGATFEGDAEGWSCSAFNSCTSIGVIVDSGGAGEWDEDFSGASPVVVHYDDGVNDRLYMLFEGSTALVGGQDDIGLAWADVSDLTTWTKFETGGDSDSDPIITNGGVGTWFEDGIVTDEIIYDGVSESVLFTHGQPADEGEFTMGRFCTTDAPDAWDDLSFSECGDINPFEGTSQLQYIWNAGTTEKYYYWDENDGDDFYLADKINTSKLMFERISTIGSPAEDDFRQQANYKVPIDTVNGVLAIDTEQTGEGADHSAGMYSVATPATDSWRLRVQMCANDHENSRGYNIIGVGANGVDRTSASNGEWEFLFNDSYAIQWQRALTNETFLVEKTSGTWGSLDTTTVSLANMDDCENEWLVSYHTAGATDLAFEIEGVGANMSAATETTLNATPKSVFVGAGQTSFGGSDLDVDFIVLQKYEDDVYTPAVGAEEDEPADSWFIVWFWF